MKDRKLMMQILTVVLISLLVPTGQAITAPKSALFNEQRQATAVSKAVPGQLNYQGFLADAADSSAVTAALEMTFRLYDADMGGTELWSETHPAVEVASGLFQVQLGSVTPFPAGLFDGTTLWLQTEVGPEALAPRKPITSAAYSHRAGMADTAAFCLMSAVDSAGVSDNAHHLEGQSLTDLDSRYIAVADLDHLDAADGDPSPAVQVDVAGRVGIGTTAPARNLHIYDDSDGVVGIEIENPNTGSSSIEMVTFTDENGGVAGIATYDEGSPYPSAMRIYNNRPNGNIRLATGSLERVRINNDGKVGIGTSTPGYTLDVNGAVNAATYWGDGSNLSGIAGAPDADWTVSNDTIYHQTGVVGIGTACPTYPLHVYNYAGYSPSYAGYFNAVGHEATGTAYAVYADAQADDENAYGIYSTASSIWGEAFAGYFDGNVKADSILLGSSSKVGQDGGLLLYNDGSTQPVVELGDHYSAGGKGTFSDSAGHWHTRLEPDIDGSGGFFEVYRSPGSWAFVVDGNVYGTEEPWVSIGGSSRTVEFNMGRSGDTSVVLPTDAVSAGEVFDEPGVSNSLGTNYVYMTVGNYYVIDSVDIDIPAPGYVEVTGGCYLNLYHTKGTNTAVWVSIDKTPQNAHFNIPGSQLGRIPDSTATNDICWQIPCTSTRLFEETSAGPQRYYLNARYYDGVSTMTNVAWAYVRAKYYPTVYGTVTLAETDGMRDVPVSSQDQGDGVIPSREPARRSVTVDDHNARLEAEMAALRFELEALKEKVQNQRR